MSFGDYYTSYFKYHPGDLSQISDGKSIKGQLVSGFSHDGKPQLRVELQIFGKVTKRMPTAEMYGPVFIASDYEMRQLRDWLVANVKD